MAKLPIPESKALNMEGLDDLSQFGKTLYEWCMSFYKPIYDRHQRAYDFYLGNQWRVYRRRGLAMVVYNIVGPHMDIIASNLTDSEIVFQTIPKSPIEGVMSEIFSESLRLACEQDSFPVQSYGLLIDALVKGYGIVKICHDTDRVVPTSIQVIDPYNYMGEPGVRRPDRDGNYHWHTEWKTALEVREMFPDKWENVKYAPVGKESSADNYEFINERGGDLSYTYMTPIRELYLRTDATEPIPPKVTAEELDGEKREILATKTPAVVLEQDHQKHIDAHNALREEIIGKLQQMAMQAVTQGKMPPEQAQQAVEQAITTNPHIDIVDKHVEEHVKMQEDNPKGHREKYNGWRRIIYGGPEFYVFDDDETPYTDSEGRGIHPYEIVAMQDTSTDIYSPSVLERCMALQEFVNLCISRLVDHLGLCSSPMLIINGDAIDIEPNQIVAVAGLILPVTGDVREAAAWLQPPQPSGEMVREVYMYTRHIELITGVSEVETGQYPNMERASQPMIQELKQASRARWREYQREFQYFLRRVGKKTLGVIQKFMTDQTQLRIGDSGNRFEILNQAQTDPEGNVLKVFNDMTVGEFDVRIKLTPLTSLTPEYKLQRALTLYTAAGPQGIAPYDIDAVAEAAEDPIMYKSVPRQKQAMQAMMQAQMQAEQTKSAR